MLQKTINFILKDVTIAAYVCAKSLKLKLGTHKALGLIISKYGVDIIDPLGCIHFQIDSRIR